MKLFKSLAAVALLAVFMLTLGACDDPVRTPSVPPPVPVITITVQPSLPSYTFTEGFITGNLTVEAAVTEGAALSYQWYSNTSNSNTGGTAENGETANSVSFAIPDGLRAGSSGTYYYFFCEVRASGGAKSLRSNAVRVYVSPLPVISITRQPEDRTFTEGSISSASLLVQASVTRYLTPSYQWYSNTSNSNEGGTEISGETGYYYVIPTDLAVGNYYYFCEVSASGGAESVRSNAVTVTVKARPVITIESEPEDAEVHEDSISGTLTVAASVIGDAVLNYQWYYNTVESTTGGTKIYTQSANCQIPTWLEMGTYYIYCEVSAPGPAYGTSDDAVPVWSRMAVITVKEPLPKITITQQPLSRFAVREGNISSSLSISASVTQDAELSYQWYRNTSNSTIGGTEETGDTAGDAAFYLPSDLTPGTHYFYCEVSATGGAASVFSIVTEIAVNPAAYPDIVIELGSLEDPDLIAQTVTITSTRGFSVIIGNWYPYQWYVDGTLEGTNNYFSFDKAPGVYELVVVVTDSRTGQKYSGRCIVTVQ